MKLKSLTSTLFFLLLSLIAFSQVSMIADELKGIISVPPDAMVQTPDRGFVITAGTSVYGAGGEDISVIKYDSNASLQWSEAIGGTGDDIPSKVINTADSGMAIVGYTNSYGAGNYDMYVIKLTASGVLQWTRTIGGTASDQGFDIIQMKDRSYLVCGVTSSYNSPSIYVARLSKTGNLLWTKCYSYYPYNTQSVPSIAYSLDGGFLMAATAKNSGGSQVQIIKADSAGNYKWSKFLSVGGALPLDILMTSLRNGDYLIKSSVFGNSGPTQCSNNNG